MDSQIDLFINNLAVERRTEREHHRRVFKRSDAFSKLFKRIGHFPLARSFPRHHKRLYSEVGALIFAAFARSQAGRLTDIFQVLGERGPD